MVRCPWCMCNEKMIRYHDEEWGVPVHDDQKQFEFLMMEVMQCGLNWNMDDPQKRDIFKSCFDNFNFDKVAAYGEEEIQRILETEGMIRSRRKIEAVIHNARCFQEIRREFDSFSDYIWGLHERENLSLYRSSERADSGEERAVRPDKQDLKKRGLKYMGSVTVYSHLQACGIINDHIESCFRYGELLELTDAIYKRRDHE